MKEKQAKRSGRRFKFRLPKSDPTSPAIVAAAAVAHSDVPPVDLTRVITGSSQHQTFGSGSSTPPSASFGTGPTALSVDTAVDALFKKQQIIRTSSIGSRSGSIKRKAIANSTAASGGAGACGIVGGDSAFASTALGSPPTHTVAAPPSSAGSAASIGFFKEPHFNGLHSQQQEFFGSGGGSKTSAGGSAVHSPAAFFHHHPHSHQFQSAAHPRHQSASAAASPVAMHSHVLPRNSSCSIANLQHKTSANAAIGTPPVGAVANSSAVATPTPGSGGAVFPFQKSKFKMAHESFRIRMFQEQYGFEPVFMTKKRTADSKFSEFKGGDLNKYTAKSYTIQNGNEIFGEFADRENCLRGASRTNSSRTTQTNVGGRGGKTLN